MALVVAGINSMMFYAPIIFKSISPANGALLSTVITGAINLVATFVSIAAVDKSGRKARPCLPFSKARHGHPTTGAQTPRRCCQESLPSTSSEDAAFFSWKPNGHVTALACVQRRADICSRSTM